MPRAAAKPDADPTTQYARDVVAGKVVAGKLVRLACERHLRDLEQGPRRGLRWDPEAAKLAFDFFGLLKHSKGKWAGERFELESWQKFVVGGLFGWKRADGTRRFRVGHLEVARKNGKSTLAAGIGLLLFVLDGEAGAEVYTVATKRDQARLTHEESKRMVKKSPALNKRVVTYKDNLHVPATHSKYEPLGADGDTLDGLNVSGWIADELHAWKNRLLWDVMETATGARSQPLGFCTTTAGHDRHSIWWERRELCIKVLEGVIEDDSLFAYIATLDEGDDWTEERNWIKGNPSLGVTVKVEDLREQCEQAKATPGKQNSFKRLRLNMPTEQASRWLSLERWNAAAGDKTWQELREALKGRPCKAGLDLSSTTDLTCLCLTFPLDEAGYACLWFFWIPAETASRRAEEDRIPYPLWGEQGALELTEGNAVDQDLIRKRIGEFGQEYQILEIAIDRWNAAQLTTQLQGDGFTVVAFGQGYASMSAPAKEVERLVVAGQIQHGGQPVQRWCISNVAIEQDAAENIKPSKAKSTGRIDGVVAMVMGIGRWMAEPAPDQPSISWI